MKKRESGKIAFFSYAGFLVLMTIWGFVVHNEFIYIPTAIGVLVSLIGAIFQFSDQEKKSLSGYSLAGVVSLSIGVYSLFRLLFPLSRGLSLILIVVSIVVFVHCINTLISKAE
jgi:uncharacterized protein YhhL (DUF1145 family)